MNTLSSLLNFLGNTLGANPSTLKTTSKTLVGGINGAWEIVYPVGSYYETSDASFDPNVSWGGTWSLETAGKVHIGAGTGYTIGATGGAATVTLTGAESGIQAHNVNTGGNFSFYVTALGGREASTSIVYQGTNTTSSGSGSNRYTIKDNGNVKAASLLDCITHSGHAHSVTAKNATSAHNNMQPYIVVNRWHRTA